MADCSPAPPARTGRGAGAGLHDAVEMRVRGARWVARARVAEHPAYLPLARHRHGQRMLAADTELVIDGFTRSGGVFTTIAFQLAQPRPVRVAHVIHAPAHLIAAAQRRVPVLLTLREPRGAVLSTMLREPYVTPEAALRSYCRFLARLLPWRGAFVVGGFQMLTSDLGAVIEAVNARFGTHFARFEASEENLRRVFELIETRTRRPPWDGWIGAFMSGTATWEELERARAGRSEAGESERFEERAARPSAAKEAAKELLAERYAEPRLAPLRARAEALHRLLLDDAEADLKRRGGGPRRGARA